MLDRLLNRRAGYPAAIVVVFSTIGLLKLFPRDLNDSTVALVLLLAVFVCAWVWESGPGAFAAVLATLGFNFFFLPPIHTFTIQDPRNVAALFVFLACGLLIGQPVSAVPRAPAPGRGRAAGPRDAHAALAGLPLRHQPRVPARRGRGPPALGACRRSRSSILLARPDGELHEAAATPGVGHPEGPLRARLPAGQLRRLPVAACRHGHLPADPHRRAARGNARGARDAVVRADGGGAARRCSACRSSASGSSGSRARRRRRRRARR